MFRFANPQYLYLLFIVVVIWGVFFYGEYKRRKNLKKFGKISAIEPLMPEVSKYRPSLKFFLQQLALILLKLFCKRIYDQKRRLRILVIKDYNVRIADVLLMYDEMNPSPNTADNTRILNITVQDISHWAGLSLDITRTEINKYVEKRKIEVYESSIFIANIAELRRTVESKLSLN